MTKNQLKSQAKWFAAFGESTRLPLILALATGEKTVTELTKMVGSEMANVSHHLSIMRAAGVATVKRDGRFKRYSLLGATVTATELVVTHESGTRVVIAMN